MICLVLAYAVIVESSFPKSAVNFRTYRFEYPSVLSGFTLFARLLWKVGRLGPYTS